MRSSFLGFEVSKRTIQLAQKALDITGNNLANVHTEGYTRQRVDISSLYLNKYSNWQTKTSRMYLAGQGATAYGVNQVRDPYIDKRYRESACFVAEYSTSADILKEVETTLDNIVSDGLPAYIDTFTDALKKYAEQPDSEELASIVRNEAYNITNLLHSYETDFKEMKESNLEALQNTIDSTNRIIKDIVDFNKKIVKEYSVMATNKLGEGESVTAGYGPNEMLDARNMLIDELAYMGNITVYDNSDGSVRILMDGIEIINGEKYEQIYMRSSTKNVDQEEYSSELLRDYYAYDAAVLRWTSGDTLDPTSGELKSYLNVLNGNGVYNTGYQNDSYGIPYYESTIDAFANDFANFLNYLNGAVDENGTLVDADRLLFCTKAYNEGTENFGDHTMTASTIRISETWMQNATMLGEVKSNKVESIKVDLAQFGNGIEYNMAVSVGDKTERITFQGGMNEKTTLDNINAALLAAFGENDKGIANVYLDGTGSIVAGAERNINITGVRTVTNYEWNLSMDGNHINEIVVALNSKPIAFGGKGDYEGTIYDYLLFINNRLAQDIAYNEAQYESAYDTTNALLDSRDAVSGVSSNEEGINMLTYQNWYSASSRMMTTLDDCLDKLINSTGRVGL